MYEIVSRGAGRVMVMNCQDRTDRYEADTFPASAPMGYFAYSLFGKPHAAVGPAPPPGVANPKCPWHPGKPVANVRSLPAPPFGASALVAPPGRAQAASDESWEQAVIGTHGRVQG